MKITIASFAFAAALIGANAANAQSSVPVTAENFVRAESDLYLSTVAVKEGGFGKFEHHRELAPIDPAIAGDVSRVLRQRRVAVAV